MIIEIVNLPSWIQASSTDLEKIQAPCSPMYCQFRDFWVDTKPLQLCGQAAEFKFECKFKTLPVIWQLLPKAIPEDNRRFWMQSQWQSSFGHATAQLGLVRRASTKHKAFPSQWQWKLEATGLLEENVLPLLWYWLSSRVKKVLMLCNFVQWQWIFFPCKLKFSI